MTRVLTPATPALAVGALEGNPTADGKPNVDFHGARGFKLSDLGKPKRDAPLTHESCVIWVEFRLLKHHKFMV